jgi:hypothetical protein
VKPYKKKHNYKKNFKKKEINVKQLRIIFKNKKRNSQARLDELNKRSQSKLYKPYKRKFLNQKAKGYKSMQINSKGLS